MLFIKQKNNLTQIDETTYDKEDQMQQYIYENPQILPVEELTGNKKLLVLIRELSTNYGRLDGLGIDNAGNVYIIETKLFRNPDRRNIIAQLLDYGVALWTEYKDPQDLITHLASKNINIKQSILDTFQTSEELADIIIENFKQNIKQGVYQFVAVADKIPPRILEQIHFINQNSRFSFYLVDLRYYRHENSEFIIPKGYGGEIIKQTSSGVSTSVRQGDLPEFLDVVETNLGLEVRQLYQELVEIFEKIGFFVEVKIGRNPTMTIYVNKKDNYLILFKVNGEIYFNSKNKTSQFNRVDFFDKIFHYKIDSNSPQKQFVIKYQYLMEHNAQIMEQLQNITNLNQ